MSEELKPCPFCGNDAIRIMREGYVDPEFVGCPKCDVFMRPRRWNARHEPDDVNRMRNLLEDVVNALDLSEIAIETHGPLGTEPAELVKLVLQQKDREIAILHHESDELPEWLIALINELREFILKSKYSDWEYSLYSDSEQFHILQCEIDKYLGYVLSLRKPEAHS